MNSAPLADRYSLAVRRNWPLCALLALTGAVLLPVLSGLQRSATTDGRLVISYDAPSVNLVKFPKDLFSGTGAFQNDIASLSSSAATDAARAAGGASLDIGLSPDGTTRTIQLSVTGASAAATDKGFDALVTALRTARKQASAATLAEFDRSVTQMKPVALERVAEIDRQIAALPPGDSLLAQALQAERSTRADDLLQLDSQRAVLYGYANDPDSQVAVLDRDHPATKRGFTVGNIVVGAALGLLVATVGIVLVTFLRRRIHTRSDVGRLLGPVPVIALPALSSGDVGEAFLRRSLQAGRRPGQAVTVLTDPVAPAIADRLRSAMSAMPGGAGDPTITIEPWSFPPVAPASAAGEGGSDVLLVVAWGKSKETSLVSIAAAVDALGATVRTVAIAGVPARYLEQAGL